MSTLTASVLAAVRGQRHAETTADDETADTTETTTQAAAEGEGAPADDTEPDPDDGKEGDEGEPDMAASETIRLAERDRIKAILTHPGAATQPGLAAELAFGDRGYSAAEAGALLATAEAATPAGGKLADRMRGQVPAIGGGPAPAAQGRQKLVADLKATVMSLQRR